MKRDYTMTEDGARLLGKVYAAAISSVIDTPLPPTVKDRLLEDIDYLVSWQCEILRADSWLQAAFIDSLNGWENGASR